MMVLVSCTQSEDEKYKKMIKSSIEFTKNYTVELAIDNGDVVDVRGDIIK